MTIHRPVDETNPFALLDENRLLRAENARLKTSNDLLLNQLFDFPLQRSDLAFTTTNLLLQYVRTKPDTGSSFFSVYFF